MAFLVPDLAALRRTGLSGKRDGDIKTRTIPYLVSNDYSNIFQIDATVWEDDLNKTFCIEELRECFWWKRWNLVQR